jgi:CBS-domain-containing membrane protein
VSPRTISERSVREPQSLRCDDSIEHAVRRLRETNQPALPVVDSSGSFAGIFGEREFMSALFPGYLVQLRSVAFLNRSLDEALERRESCRGERVEQHMNREHIDVSPDHSDTQLAEIFLHHRVLIIPVVDNGRVTGVITRTDFFHALAERFLSNSADATP